MENSMNEELTLVTPEAIADEQLEEVAGGFGDNNQNNNCKAGLIATVAVGAVL
jgi:hypothetical protein